MCAGAGLFTAAGCESLSNTAAADLSFLGWRRMPSGKLWRAQLWRAQHRRRLAACTCCSMYVPTWCGTARSVARGGHHRSGLLMAAGRVDDGQFNWSRSENATPLAFSPSAHQNFSTPPGRGSPALRSFLGYLPCQLSSRRHACVEPADARERVLRMRGRATGPARGVETASFARDRPGRQGEHDHAWEDARFMQLLDLQLSAGTAGQ